MVYYDSSYKYIESCETLETKIAAIEAIIDTLMLMATEAAGTSNYQEYFLDDGQTKISTKYRTIQDVYAGINAFERLKQMYVNRLNGRVVRLVDGKNFTGGYPWR